MNWKLWGAGKAGVRRYAESNLKTYNPNICALCEKVPPRKGAMYCEECRFRMFGPSEEQIINAQTKRLRYLEKIEEKYIQLLEKNKQRKKAFRQLQQACNEYRETSSKYFNKLQATNQQLHTLRIEYNLLIGTKIFEE